MENIKVQFTYDIADELYHTTNELKDTATATYIGPAKQYWAFDDNTNKWTGQSVSFEVHQTYNERLDDGFYSVEIDCTKNPLLCSLASSQFIDKTNWPTSTEVIPNSAAYTRDNPPDPLHTYNNNDIYYNRQSNTFTPLTWKTSSITWDEQLSFRNSRLNNTDRLLSEDLPESLYNDMIEYRQYLRDFTKTFGAAWIVTLASGGTGFAVGNKLAISDSRLKANQLVNDVMVTVTKIDAVGAIEEFTVSDTRSTHITAATSFTEVYYTTNGAGVNASFTVAKAKLIDPWKLEIKIPPIV
tara:strand:- start:1785 stop:2678 length:894 start_codon:yes stop_codon:yes gene_type:complete